MINKKVLIREVFTNYGYIVMESVESNPEAEWLKKDMKKRFVEYTATGSISNDWPEYKIKGPRSAVFDVFYKYWNDGSSKEDQIDIFDMYWIKI